MENLEFLKNVTEEDLRALKGSNPKGFLELARKVKEYQIHLARTDVNHFVQYVMFDEQKRRPLRQAPYHVKLQRFIDRNKYSVTLGHTESGKDLAVTEQVPTPSGWRTMGDLQVGDYVYAMDGTPTQIIATTGVFTGHRCFRVRFSDGAEIVAGEDHEWLAWAADQYSKGKAPQVVTTGEMFRRVVGVGAVWLVPLAGQIGAAPGTDCERTKTIESITEVDSVPTRCITVAHPSHTFLVGSSYTVTHNCCVGSTLLIDQYGCPTTVLQLRDRLARGEQVEVVTLDTISRRARYVRVKSVFEDGIRPCRQIRTASGVITTVSTNHPFRVNRPGTDRYRWIQAGGLKAGDMLVTTHQLPPPKTKLESEMTAEDAFVVGFLTRHLIQSCGLPTALVEKLPKEEIGLPVWLPPGALSADAHYDVTRIAQTIAQRYGWKVVAHGRHTLLLQGGAVEWLQRHGVQVALAQSTFASVGTAAVPAGDEPILVPRAVLADGDRARAYLVGFLTSTVAVRDRVLIELPVYTTAALRHLFARAGVTCKLNPRFSIDTSSRNRTTRYRVQARISGGEVTRLLEQVRLVMGPYYESVVMRHDYAAGILPDQVLGALEGSSGTRDRARPVVWSKDCIREVTDAGEQMVYGIEIDDEQHTHLTDCILTHNTQQVSIGRTLFELGRDVNKRITIIQSTGVMARDILKTITAHIENNPRLHEVFPHLKPGDMWTQTAITVQRGYGIKDPSVQVRGAFAKILGVRIDYLVCHEIGTPILHNDEWIPVEKHPTARFQRGDGYSVSVWGLPFQETVTSEHRYWARRITRRGVEDAGWVEAKDLGPDHYIGTPIDTRIEGVRGIPERVNTATNTMGYRGLQNNWAVKELPQRELDDPEWWWLIGLWWGDGHSAKQPFGFTFSGMEAFLRATAVIDKYGYRWYYGSGERPGCWQINVSSAKWSRWLRSWRTGNSMKCPPTWVERVQPEYQAALIRGYVDADGYVDSRDGQAEVRITSVHVPGLLAARRILSRLGVPASIRKGVGATRSTIAGVSVNCQPKFDLRFHLRYGAVLGLTPKGSDTRWARSRNRVFIENGFLWSKVRQLVPVSDRAFVPIQTNDHTYVTAFGLSHNCDDVLTLDYTRTKHMRGRIREWFISEVMSRITEDAKVIVLGNAWHPEDLHHELMENPRWASLRLPVRDPITKLSYWPEVWPQSRIAEFEAARTPDECARALDCIARSDDMSRFHDVWFRRALNRGIGLFGDLSLLPSLESMPVDPDTGKPKIEGVTFSGVDLAFTDKERSDWNVIFTILLDAEGHVYLLNIERFRGPTNETVRRIVDTHKRYGSTIFVESVAAQRAVIDWCNALHAEVPVFPFGVRGQGEVSNKWHGVYGVEMVAAELANNQWTIPQAGTRDDPGEINDLVREWIKECKNFAPDTHTGDILMACVTPGQLVQTRAGRVPVESVAVGDEVLTHKGRWRRVTKTMSRHFNGEVVRVTAAGGHQLTLTPEHPVYTPQLGTQRRNGNRLSFKSWGWSPVGEITTGRKKAGSWLLAPAVPPVPGPPVVDMAELPPAPVKHATKCGTKPAEAGWGVKVTKLERLQYEGPVYNFHVEEDESYTVDGVAVHNCWLALRGARLHHGQNNMTMVDVVQPGETYNASVVGLDYSDLRNRAGEAFFSSLGVDLEPDPLIQEGVIPFRL